MINVPILGQRDPRWVNTRLGFIDSSQNTIGNYGCTLTGLTALAKRNNVAEVNKFFIALGNYNAATNPKGAFLGNLVVWGNVAKALKNLKFVGRYTGYDNAKVADYVYNKKIPVLVEVDAAPIGSPRTSHWLLFLGDQKCLDPWVGQIRSTGDFPVRKGFALYDYVDVPPELTCEEKLKFAEDKINRIREVGNRPDLGDSLKLAEIKKIHG